MTAPSLQLSANLSFLFTDSPFEERFARAARAGFRQRAVWVDEDELFSVQLLQCLPRAA